MAFSGLTQISMQMAAAGITVKPCSELSISPKLHLHNNRSFQNVAHVRFPVPSTKRTRQLLSGRTLCNSRASPFLVHCSTEELRRILASPGVHQGPACHDALSAKLVENAGFSFTFMSGFAVSAARLALPDAGLISLGEMVDQGRQITAAVKIPVIGDGDNGYGNALNVKRTVKSYIEAGFAGILLEDQVNPKACGHTKGRKVVSREEAVMRIRAAVDARQECSSDIVIIARTDARQAVSFSEALWRTEAFAEAGADVLFIDALSSKEEMQKFCSIAPGVPKMANMLEGGGKTPILTPMELEELGFKIVAYPLSLIGVSISAMQDALIALKGGRLPPPSDLPSFDEIKRVVGFDAYYEEEKKYIISEISKSEQRTVTTEERSSKSGNTSDSDSELQISKTESIVPDVLEDFKYESGSRKGIWTRTLRVKVTANNGVVKLDVKIPAGFLDGMAKIIPGVAGINIPALLDESVYNFDGKMESGQELLDINDGRGDRIQIFLE